jgi:hypothetical protein
LDACLWSLSLSKSSDDSWSRPDCGPHGCPTTKISRSSAMCSKLDYRHMLSDMTGRRPGHRRFCLAPTRLPVSSPLCSLVPVRAVVKENGLDLEHGLLQSRSFFTSPRPVDSNKVHGFDQLGLGVRERRHNARSARERITHLSETQKKAQKRKRIDNDRIRTCAPEGIRCTYNSRRTC